MKNIFVLMLLLSFVVQPTVIMAEEVVRVGDILVEDTEEQRAVTERKESSYAKTVITKKEMEELGGQTAADVLRRLPRMYFSGPPATNKDVRMAGLDKEFQNVLINGNRPPGGGEKREFALDRIPVESIERIEVLKNPTAAYDSDAIAGIVNIILKEAPKKRTMSVSAGGYSNSIADKTGSKVTLFYGDGLEKLDYGITAARNDEYRSKTKDVADSSKNEAEAEMEVVRTTTNSVTPVLTYRPGERDTITFKPYVTAQKEVKDKERLVTDLSTGSVKSKNVEDETKDMDLRHFGADWEHRFSGGSLLKLTGVLTRNDEDKDKITSSYTGTAFTFSKNIFEDETKVDREWVFGADYKMPVAGLLGMDQVMSMGLKHREKNRSLDKFVYEVSNTGAITVTSTPNDSYRVEETISAVYVMDEASVTENFVLTPGVRVEITDGEYTTSNGRKGSGDFTDWNPSLHGLYRFGKGYQVRGSVAKTIGRPPFKDKVPTRSVKADKIEEGNPDLAASESVNYEMSVEKYFGRKSIVAVGAFYKDVTNIIEKKQTGIDALTGLPVIMPVNVAEAVAKGVELEAKSDLEFIGLPDFTLTTAYTILGSEVKDPNTGATRRLKEQPRTLANAILRYEAKPLGLTASVGMSYIGEKIDESDPLKPRKVEKSFTQWDASITQKLGRDWSLFGSAINIFGEKKEKFDGLRAEQEETGTTYFLGLRYEI